MHGVCYRCLGIQVAPPVKRLSWGLAAGALNCSIIGKASPRWVLWTFCNFYNPTVLPLGLQRSKARIVATAANAAPTDRVSTGVT
jgi:hypothetical protein